MRYRLAGLAMLALFSAKPECARTIFAGWRSGQSRFPSRRCNRVTRHGRGVDNEQCSKKATACGVRLCHCLGA
jgi:hypothetical protein